MTEKLLIIADEGGERLDSFIASQADGITRSFASNLIKQGLVTIDGKPSKPNTKIKPGSAIEIELLPPTDIELKAQDIPLDIIYQDSDIAVINKAQGMVVHPAAGNPDGTLVNALMYHIKDLAGIGGELRPGIVHRIDKDTSGLIVIAKNDKAHLSLSNQIKEKSAGRIYLAIAYGNFPNDSGSIDAPIARSQKDRKKMAVIQGGRSAVTHYEVLERFGTYTLLKCTLETGRTHQIRVHLTHIGHPIAGDQVYCSSDRLKLGSQALHAYELHLIHPSTLEPMSFKADPPLSFEKCLKKLRSLCT